MAETTRRQFIAGAGVAAVACACAGCPLLAEARRGAGRGGAVDVGPLEDFGADGVDGRWAADGFFVVRRRGRLYAVSSICTHKKVELVVAGGGGGFKCPRHGSLFSAAGHATKAPARKSLARFGIRLDDAGHVIINPARPFREGQWGDAGSFIALESSAEDPPAKKRRDS